MSPAPGQAMTESKVMLLHTEGPWNVRDHTTPSGGRHIWVEGGPPIGKTMAGPYKRQILEDEDYAEKLSDAMLVAAAPDLLTAARAFLEPYKEVSDKHLHEIAFENWFDPNYGLNEHQARAVLAFRKIIEQAGETK